MKILVIGGNGQLGSDILTVLSKEDSLTPIRLSHSDIEITEFDSSYAILKSLKPDVVINTAASHNVEKCETDPVSSFQVNGLGAKNLAYLANDLKFKIVHFSTDYVFDGKKKQPYIESDLPLPLNVYGNTKLCGENFIQAVAKNFLILRVSGLFGLHPCRAKGGLNFVKLMLKLSGERESVRVVNNEILTPTFTNHVALQLFKLLQTDATGLFHCTAEGYCSWYEFARNIFDIANIKTKLEIADPNEFSSKVPRPLYSVLENQKLKDNQLNIMPHWEVGLREYLKLCARSGG